MTEASSTRTLPFFCPTTRARREAEDPLEKRQLAGLLNLAGGQIAAGCSCLDLDPRTVTSTITPIADVSLVLLYEIILRRIADEVTAANYHHGGC